VAFTAALAAGGAPAQESRPREVRPIPPRDRYTASRPFTLERFRSVFDAYDLDGDGRITRREAAAAGRSVPLACGLDLDGDGVVDRDEFDLGYAREVIARGQQLDAKLAQRIRDLEEAAKTRRWNVPASRPAAEVAAGDRTPAEAAIGPRPSAENAPAARPTAGDTASGGRPAASGSPPSRRPAAADPGPPRRPGPAPSPPPSNPPPTNPPPARPVQPRTGG